MAPMNAGSFSKYQARVAKLYISQHNSNTQIQRDMVGDEVGRFKVGILMDKLKKNPQN